MGTTTRIGVTVTFLRQDAPPLTPAARLPDSARLVRVERCTVAFYRYLYDTVGAPYVWWLRRVAPDAQLREMLESPGVYIHVLYQGGEPAGFFELDARMAQTVNLSYFGLMPHAVGRGMGTAFLRAAIDASWALRPARVTVNTCTADHPRALPSYLRAGFQPVRSVQETWDVPDRLGLSIPPQLRV
jgi:GNAT superfamily N-acetyltransferase